jgi:hypothetical protein
MMPIEPATALSSLSVTLRRWSSQPTSRRRYPEPRLPEECDRDDLLQQRAPTGPALRTPPPGAAATTTMNGSVVRLAACSGISSISVSSVRERRA